MEKKTLYLIDMYSLIYRSYYAHIRNPRINSKQMDTSAPFGVVQILDSLFGKHEITHIIAAYDLSAPTFRHKKYPAYKANREAMPEPLRNSIPYIKKIVDAFGILSMSYEGYEADDVIGTLAKQAEKEGFQSYMLTNDKDYGQLVSDNIKQFKPEKGGLFSLVGEAEVCRKLEITKSSQIIDYLSLVGDSSDNIPGCFGIGQKTASSLLREYQNIDGIYANLSKLPEKTRRKLSENRDQVLLSKELATICTDVPVSFSAEEAKYTEKNVEILKELYEELEFRSLFRKIANVTKQDKGDLAPIRQLSLFDKENTPEHTMPQEAQLVTKETVHLSGEGLKAWIAQAQQAKWIALHFFLEEKQIKVLAIDGENLPVGYLTLSEDQRLPKEIIQILQNPAIAKTVYDAKPLLVCLHRNNALLQGELFDIQIAHYLLFPEQSHAFSMIVKQFLSLRIEDYEDFSPARKQHFYEHSSEQERINIATRRVPVVSLLREPLQEKLQKSHLNKLFHDMEIPLVRLLANMEIEGVKISPKCLQSYGHELRSERVQLKKEIHQLAGLEFNISSTKQLGEVLFDHMEISKVKKTKTKQHSTSEETLRGIANLHPIIDKILTYRSINKLLSSYIDALPKLMTTENKIHANFNQTVAVTGRLSSNNPNLQNIPIRDERGRNIRKAFIPSSPNGYIISADYSQIELRVMASLADDKHMQEAFEKDLDIHTATASRIYGIPLTDVDKTMRRSAKTANFGILYGISAFGLAKRLGIPRKEANELIQEYFNKYPQIKTFIDSTIEKVKELGYTETLYGRRRYLPEINSDNAQIRAYAERNAVNTPIQGTAADIIKNAMLLVDKELSEKGLKCKLILQVHDELVFDVPEGENEILPPILKQVMENSSSLKVPMKVEISNGRNWLEAHE